MGSRCYAHAWAVAAVGRAQIPEAQVIDIVRRHMSAQFPKTCSRCGVVFASVASYHRAVEHIGDPMSFDAPAEGERKAGAVGAVSFANCTCGTTLSITTRGMAPADLQEIMDWVRLESERRDVDVRKVLAELRAKIIAQIRADPR